MGLIGRSFVIAALTAGTLVTALVLRTEGATNRHETTIHVAKTASPMRLNDDGGTKSAGARRVALRTSHLAD